MRALLAALLWVSAAASAQVIYRWTDKKGEVHYTDDRSTVPAGAKVETTAGEELMVVTSPPKPKSQPVSLPPIDPRLAPPTMTRGRKQGPVEVRLTQVKVAISDGDRLYIEEALKTASASPGLAAWGGLRESVEVEVTPAAKMVGYVGTDAFGLAVGTNRMLLRAPKDLPAYGLPLDYAGAAQHELMHILENQLAGPFRPPWFGEGFACVVAEQTLSSSIEDIAWWVIHEGGPRPLDDLFTGRCNIHLAYAISQQAVRLLMKLVGERGVREMFELRAKGVRFEAAFSKVAGFTVDEFQGRFIESLRPNYFDRAR